LSEKTRDLNKTQNQTFHEITFIQLTIKKEHVIDFLRVTSI